MLLFHLFIHVRFLDHLQDSLDRLKGLGLVAFFQKVVLFLYSWDIESNHLVICLALAQLICRSVNQKETFAITSKLSIQSDTFMSRGIHISQRYWYCSSYASLPKISKRRGPAHGGFEGTIGSVPYSRQLAPVGFCAFDKKITIGILICYLRVGSDGNREDVWWCLLGCSLPTFHIIFQEFNTKCVKLGNKP